MEGDSADDEAGEVDFAVYPPRTYSVPNQPRQVSNDEVVSFEVDHRGTRREIIQRDDDILTPQQVQQHCLVVESAMLRDLWSCKRLSVS